MKKIAILIENMFDARELIYPYYRLLEAGFLVDLVGSDEDTVYTAKSGLTEKSTHASRDVDASDYDGVVIPGGFSPDYMRRSEATKKFVRDLDEQNKTIAAVCHGPWLLASSANIKGKNVTSYPSIKDDLINAGANWHDEGVVVDANYITSRTPADLPAFLMAIIEKVNQ